MYVDFLDVHVMRDERVLLECVNVSLREHRIGVVGLNGSGKSTFAKLINGLIKPTTGNVCVNSFDSVKEQNEVLRLVGFTFQNPDHQIIYPIVHEDIAFGLQNKKLKRDEIKQIVEQALAKFSLEHLSERHSYTLSGGEKQLVALAGTLVLKPELIVLDEPTTALDLKRRSQVIDGLMSLEEDIVVVSHDLEMLEEFDRVLVMHEGRLVADDAPKAAILEYRKLIQ